MLDSQKLILLYEKEIGLQNNYQFQKLIENYKQQRQLINNYLEL